MITTETQNGRIPGRGVPALPTHTFRDSGITVKLHKLSPLTGQDIAAQVQREYAADKPEPPMYEVDYGKGKVMEPNTSHEVYVNRLKRWQDKCNNETLKRLFHLACLDAVEMEITDAIRDQIKRKKRLMKVTTGIIWEDNPDLDQDENDQLFYITHIACGSQEDLKEFYEAIATRSGPTEAAIERHKELFPGDVSE